MWQNIFRSSGSAAVRGWLVTAVLVLGFGLWSALTPLEEGAMAIGKVAAAGSRRIVQSKDGGVVKHILVAEGDAVEAGQKLVELETGPLLANLESAERASLSNWLAAEKFRAARNLLTTLPPAPPVRWLSDGERNLLAKSEQSALISLTASQRARLASIDEQVAQVDAQLRGNQASSAALVGQTDLLQKRVDALRPLVSDGLAAAVQLWDAEREFFQYSGQLQAQREDYERLTRQRKGLLQQRLSAVGDWDSSLAAQMAQAEGGLADAKARIAGLSDMLAHAIIEAPVKGQVVGLTVHTVGGIVSPAQPLMTLAPADDSLIAEVQVKVTDGDVVHAGMPAEIRFSSLPRRSTPLLRGKVISMAADITTDSQIGNYYLARVAVSEQEFRRLVGVSVTQGMPVEALLKSRSRTIMDYLLTPWTTLFERAMRED